MVMQVTRNSWQPAVMRGDIKVIFIFPTIHYIRATLRSVVNHRALLSTVEDKTAD